MEITTKEGRIKKESTITIAPLAIDYDAIRADHKLTIVSGFRKKRRHAYRLFKNVLIIVGLYKTPARVRRVLRKLKERRNMVAGADNVQKVVRVSDRYYWRMFLPGWGSPLFHRFLLSELNRIEPHGRPVDRLALAYVAITKKCPLKCAHCFEWDNLNQPEKLSTADISKMIENLQSIGTINIAFSGGEPMLRVDELTKAIAKYKHDSAFWVLTSGFNCTAHNIKALKEAGLIGLIVSLDHFDPYQHDLFRGKEGAFRDALYAIKYGIENDLVTAISTCVTRENATIEYLDRFMMLAKDLGVGFVQLLEPKAVGHYAGKDVTLLPDQLTLLEEFFIRYNSERAYKDFPVIIYHGHYQRKMGCLSAGNRGIYVDTNGDLLSCPFCHNKSGSLLEPGFRDSIENMLRFGCAEYGNFD